MNLLQEDDALILLDWEYAHVADPLWDLAGWCANNDFEAEMQRSLLTRYLGNAPILSEWQRFRLLLCAVRLRLLAVESTLRKPCGAQRRMALPNAQDCSTRACAFRHTTPPEESREGSNGGFDGADDCGGS